VLDDEGDGSGTIKDLRNKLWRVEGREMNQPWVQYAWKDGAVCSGYRAKAYLFLGSRGC